MPADLAARLPGLSPCGSSPLTAQASALPQELLPCELGREVARAGRRDLEGLNAALPHGIAAAIVTVKAVCWRWMRAPKGSGEPSNCCKLMHASKARATVQGPVAKRVEQQLLQTRLFPQAAHPVGGAALALAVDGAQLVAAAGVRSRDHPEPVSR